MSSRSWTVGTAAALSAACAGAAIALTLHPGAAGAEPTPTCGRTMVVVEWHDAQNAPTKGLSAKCADPGRNPFDALKNAQLSPVTQVETAVGTVLCSILNAPATTCKQLPDHAAWTYWYVDPNSHQWQGPYTSPPNTPAADQSPSTGSGGPGVGAGPQPSPAPPVEDWVYQSDYPAHPVKPAYYVQGSPPTSAPSTTAPPIVAPSRPGPSTQPAPSGSAVPSVPDQRHAPRPQAQVTHSRHRHASRGSQPTSPPVPAHSSAPATTTAVDQADGFSPPQITAPPLPDVALPDQWWIAADRSRTTLTREGQASNTAWATAAPSDHSADRLAWSTGLGSVAVVLLGIGLTTQLRRRRSG